MKRSLSFWLLWLPTAALFYAALFLTLQLRYPAGLPHKNVIFHLQAFSLIYVMWMLVFFIHRMFDFVIFRRYTTLIFSLVSAMSVNLLIAIIYFYAQPGLILTPRRFLLVDVLVSFVLVLMWNLILKWSVFSRLVQPVYLFSFNDELKYLEQEIAKHDYMGFKVQGHLNDEELKSLSTKGAIIIFPDNLHANPALASAIFSLRNKGIKFYNHNNFYEQLLRRIYLYSLNEIWLLENINYSRNFFYNAIKSVFDFLIGLILFVIFAISFPIIAILIKLTSKGRILFAQKRVGKDGKIFAIYKYRTMVSDQDGNTWTQVGDKRITGFGKFLRLVRLDELPQCLNLLMGQMSVVGPRPEQVNIVEELKKQIPFYDERHIVKPGLTGWAQLNIYAGSVEETKIKLEYDLYYVKNQSLLLDLEILLKTIYYIFTGQGR